jgi:DNA polymerase-3 subunit gamma/tau
MGQALYRKHRPKSLHEVVGQEHITQTLEQALKEGRISHAYLFTGPRGVGKTSIARIWAHEINGLPYTDDSMHLDIIEIDAASNRRIDEIRELRDKVSVAPTSAKYKVYIIDEVHMLTREAFNALLKTLEEPPAHAVFILATTDAHKLPDTIISRTQRYNFKPVEAAKVIEHLRQIAQTEKLQVDDEALALLAEHGEGSFRDSISLLDQASSNGQSVDLVAVQQLLGIPSNEAISELLALTTDGAAPAKLMSALSALYDQGYQAAAIAQRLGQAIRSQLAENRIADHDQAYQLLGDLIEVPASQHPERRLEIVLLQASPRPSGVAAKVVSTPKPEPAAPEANEPADEPLPEAPPEAVTEETAPELAAAPASNTTASAVLDAALWPQVLQALKQKHNTLYGVVRMAQPTFGDDSLTLAFAFPFHQKRSNEAANRQRLADIISELTGVAVKIDCIVDKNASTPTLPVITTVNAPKPVASNDIATISNIFGSAELLES